MQMRTKSCSFTLSLTTICMVWTTDSRHTCTRSLCANLLWISCERQVVRLQHAHAVVMYISPPSASTAKQSRSRWNHSSQSLKICAMASWARIGARFIGVSIADINIPTYKRDERFAWLWQSDQPCRYRFGRASRVQSVRALSQPVPSPASNPILSAATRTEMRAPPQAARDVKAWSWRTPPWAAQAELQAQFVDLSNPLTFTLECFAKKNWSMRHIWEQHTLVKDEYAHITYEQSLRTINRYNVTQMTYGNAHRNK